MNYLSANKPKFTLWFITIILITNILSMIFRPIDDFSILYPSNLGQPWNWYRLITFPLAGVGLLNWLINSIVLVVTGYIIENRLKKNDPLLIILISSVIGGLIFIIFNQNDAFNRGIAGPTIISWGYWAATIIVGIKFWKGLNIFEKIVLILCFLSVTSLTFENFGFILAQAVVIVCILAFTLIRIKNKN